MQIARVRLSRFRGLAYKANRMCHLVRHAVVTAALVASLVSCGSGAAAAPPRELVVFEAASLKDAFAQLARRFQHDNPGARVVANPAGSQELRAQIEHGAAADVIATADRKQMDALAAQGLIGAASVFTCNEPVLVVRAGLASVIKSLGDLPRAERIVIGAAEVPIGAYTVQILRNAAATHGVDFAARVQAKVASRELSVRQVLAKVVLGEADAGVVYRTDAIAAGGKVTTVSIPPELNVRAEYFIALLAAAPQSQLARRWVDLVMSPAGRAALRDAGFAACPRQ